MSKIKAPSGEGALWMGLLFPVGEKLRPKGVFFVKNGLLLRCQSLRIISEEIEDPLTVKRKQKLADALSEVVHPIDRIVRLVFVKFI